MHDSLGPFSGGRSKKGHMVWLHVYDLDSVVAHMNELFLQSLNLGAFHCGVEVLDREWFASWGLSDRTGVIWHRPKMHSVHIYKESLFMGESPLSEDEIKVVLCDAMDDWPENSYHPISRNCVTFAEELLFALRVPEPFPAWARGAADAASSRVLFPIADYGWEWAKWWKEPQRPPTVTSAVSVSGEEVALGESVKASQVLMQEIVPEVVEVPIELLPSLTRSQMEFLQREGKRETTKHDLCSL